jgi:hypothetical protein
MSAVFDNDVEINTGHGPSTALRCGIVVAGGIVTRPA